MIIGVPKEIKANENRVALTPAGAAEFIKNGHEVYVQTGGGIGSGFKDEDYIAAGSVILPTIEDISFRKGLNIVKGKVVYIGVAEAFNLSFEKVKNVL